MDKPYVNWEKVLADFCAWFEEQEAQPDWESQFDKLVELVDAQIYPPPEPACTDAEYVEGIRWLTERFDSDELRKLIH